MLYKLTVGNAGANDLEPLPFLDFADLGKVEKDLEVLLASHLLDVLFEGAALMPVFQERRMQAEADLYALNSAGDLSIFEIKRGVAGADAMLQALRYAQEAGLWTFNTLQDKFRTYCNNATANLAESHREAFNLERPLLPSEFNKRQHFLIVGNSANDTLINAVDYWKQRGLSVDFLPYRIYTIGEQNYFEFFALPYDRHINPALLKGVLFDTNRSWDFLKAQGGYGCLQEMMSKSRVSAYGDRKEAVCCFSPGDFVFYSHVGHGIVGAAKIKGKSINKVNHDEYDDEWFWNVELLTPVPIDFTKIPALSFSEVTSLLGKGFYWARTDKRPYLMHDESELLLKELKRVISSTT